MRRITAVLVVAFMFVLVGARGTIAQPAPLPPDQVDPGVTAAIAQYVASRGYSYGGSCQLATPDLSGAECSLSYLQDDGSIYVVLAVVQGNASAGPQVDQFIVPAALAAAASQPPVAAQPSSATVVTPNQNQPLGLLPTVVLPQRLRTRGQDDPAQGLIGQQYSPVCSEVYQNYSVSVLDAISSDASKLDANSSGNLILLLVDATNNTNRLDQYSGVVTLQDGRGRTFRMSSARGEFDLVDELNLGGVGAAVHVSAYQTARLLWLFPVPADVQAPLQLVSMLAPEKCTNG